MSKIRMNGELAAKTSPQITKQININPDIFSAHLIPITTTEESFTQIQQHIHDLEKLVNLYRKLYNRNLLEHENRAREIQGLEKFLEELLKTGVYTDVTITHHQAFEALSALVNVDQRLKGMFELDTLEHYIKQQISEERYLSEVQQIALSRFRAYSDLEGRHISQQILLDKYRELFSYAAQIGVLYHHLHGYKRYRDIIEEIKELEKDGSI